MNTTKTQIPAPAVRTNLIGKALQVLSAKPVTVLLVFALIAGLSKPILLVLANIMPNLAGIAFAIALGIVAFRFVKSKL